MALTVGDIRKALSKYSDDTIIAAEFGDDFSPWTSCSPIKANGAFVVKNISKNDLYNKTWFKADLRNRKVISIDYNPLYSNEFWAESEDASPYWKPKIEAETKKRIAEWKPPEYYFTGPIYY